MNGLSIIIINHNYEKYLDACLQSALRVQWPKKEIIFIDDGSTDKSLEVAAKYKNQIKIKFLKHSGQRKATNLGFMHSSFNCCIFLDSDDLLEPHIAKKIFAIFSEQTSKIQYQSFIIDSNGNKTGNIFPRFPKKLTPDKIIDFYKNTLHYPCSVGTGNAYNKNFLNKMFPLADTCGPSNDSILLAAAPIYGEVKTISEPLASYRIHDKNSGAISQFDPYKFTKETKKALLRAKFAIHEFEKNGITIKPDTLSKNLNYLQFRICSFIFDKHNHPVPQDTRFKILINLFNASLTPQGNTIFQTVIKISFITVMVFLPTCLARFISVLRFNPALKIKKMFI